MAALGRGIRTLGAGFVTFNQQVADRAGINLTDLQCLNILEMTGPVSAGRLAELLGLTTGAITGVVDRLERAGYARRQRDLSDRRRVIVQVAPDAQRRLAGHYEVHDRRTAEVLSAYSDAELALILDFFTRLTAPTADPTEEG